ncbi:MAG: hypothetical protein Q9187_007542, partial [Circinaria calcarea]
MPFPLPREVSQQILAKTDLVSHSSDGDSIPGIHIKDGEITYPVEHDINWHDASSCNCRPLPTNLLRLGPTLDDDARFTLLSQNRLVLRGSPARSLAFLRAQGSLVRHIRALDFQFMPQEIEAWTKPGTPWKAEWADLINFIAANLQLENLILSLDAGPGYTIYEEQNAREEDLAHVLNAYRAMVEPMRILGERGLKGFFVYWACFHAYEAEAEKEVMGQHYVAKDKIPSNERQPFYPHGCPFE